MAQFIISIHSPRVRGDLGGDVTTNRNYISIHSPRVRGDKAGHSIYTKAGNFYPLPSGEGRHKIVAVFWR